MSRKTVARHAPDPRRSPWKRALTLVVVSLAVVAVSAAAVVGFTIWDLSRSLADETIAAPSGAAAPPDIGAHEGAFSILLVGSDVCEPEYAHLFGERCEDDEEGERSDVTMLVHVSEAPRRATIISFPRDMIVPIPECPRADGEGSHSAMAGQPMYSTMTYGGVACTWLTVSELTEMDIPFAAKITWGGVIEMSNAIGGVDVCVEGSISDPDANLFLGPGWHNVEGAQALAFLRTRYGVGDHSDLGRISNQQQFLTSLVRKVRSEGVLTDPAAVLRLAYAAVDAITPSDSMKSPTTMVQLALALKDIPLEDIVFAQYPTYYDPDDPNRVRPDTESGAALIAAVMANQPLQLTGEASGGDGVNVVEPTGEPTPDPSATPVDRVQLPDNIPGTTADQVTCSVGTG